MMKVVVGIDEVGRGCWAGPLVAGAVILNRPIAGLKDSKLLSKRQRISLATEIKTSASAQALGWVTAQEVDELGLTKAVRLAMQRALRQITRSYDKIIIDGSYNFLTDNDKSEAVIKADRNIPAVSAASIIAKVARDQYMIDMHSSFPNYSFNKHVGYGTSLHLKQLRQFGPCTLHRRSYKPIIKLLAAN